MTARNFSITPLEQVRIIAHAFWDGLQHPSRKQCIHAEKELRASLSEKQIDRMIEASFPASDPPSTY
jgi:hypothetical protein